MTLEKEQTLPHSETRRKVAETIQLLSSPSEQLAYERNVPIADVFAELVESGNDIMKPRDPHFVAAFSNQELDELCVLRGLIVLASRSLNPNTSMSEIIKTPEWRAVVKQSQNLSIQLRA